MKLFIIIYLLSIVFPLVIMGAKFVKYCRNKVFPTISVIVILLGHHIHFITLFGKHDLYAFSISFILLGITFQILYAFFTRNCRAHLINSIMIILCTIPGWLESLANAAGVTLHWGVNLLVLLTFPGVVYMIFSRWFCKSKSSY